MPLYEHYHDTVHWHMSDITSRIVAESGIPSDRFHFGKIILQSLKDSPDLLAQIEGTSGESETNSSVLRRTVQCALALKKLGLQTGDVMILMAPHHLDLVVPFYAALYLGIIVAPIDRCLVINELKDTFTDSRPKLVFCQSEKVEDIRKALKELEMKPKVITFDKGDGDISFSELMEQECDSDEVARFRCTDFDPAETIAMLVSTSGSTGFPKQSASTHKNFSIVSPYVWVKTVTIPAFEKALVVSNLQWLTAIILYLCAPYMKFTRIQSRQAPTQEHLYELINKYRPSFTIISPTMLTTLIRPGDREKCDFSCFERILVGGSAMCLNLREDAELVDIETRKDINEPYVKGELWLKGPGFFKGYYNNPEMTKEAFEGDWFMTGDLLYRDEHWNFFVVERLKMLLKYKNHQISPAELEAVLREHPGVMDAAVGGVPDPECGELPVAFVVRAPGHAPTEQEIKDFVKDSLTDTKQLRGGVIFLEQLAFDCDHKAS